MSKSQKFEIEINFVDGTTREDVENVMAMWHAKQVERRIAEMPADLARQVIRGINDMKRELMM